MATMLRALSTVEAEALCGEVAQAVERGECHLLELPGLDPAEKVYLVGRVEQFQRQCQFLTDNGMTVHPCIILGEHAVPLAFSPDHLRSVPARPGVDRETILAEILASDAKTRVDMVDISSVKRTFAQRFVEFVAAAMERIGFGGGGDDGGHRGFDGESAGMEVTVTSNSHGLQVVYSEQFMIRDKRSENAFGESLTSPVKGRITQAGLYYFGTADNDTTNWARFTFKIPPTRIVNLMH